MRGLEKNPAPNGANTQRRKHTQTDGHGDYMTELAQWGRFTGNLEKGYLEQMLKYILFTIMGTQESLFPWPRPYSIWTEVPNKEG